MTKSFAHKLAKITLQLITMLPELVYALLSGNQKRKMQSLKRKESLYIFLTGNGSHREEIANLKTNREQHLVLAVNSFCKSSEYGQVKPDIYAINDPIFFSTHNEKSLSREDHAKAIHEKTNWPMTIVVPSYAKHSKFIEEISSNKFISTTYINIAPFSHNSKLTRHLYLAGYGLPKPTNVLVWTLSIALWLKLEKITLIGASFDFYKEFKISEEGHILKERNGKSEPHYHTRRETGSYKPRMGEALEYISQAYYSLYMIEDSANSIDVEIKNATKDTMLDCFTR